MEKMHTTDKSKMMKRKLSFTLKQFLKMALQNMILPFIYNFWKIVYRRQEPNLIIFADAHHDSLPYSMEQIHNALQKKGYTLTDEIYNFAKISQLNQALISIRFMKLYAQAKYIFICDNFLPVSSCKKSNKTTVIQLWHCCGLMKKMGYDAPEDIPPNYKGKVYGNYDIVTVSSPACEKPIGQAMGLPTGIVQALGVSRTDVYFDSNWIEQCKAEFYRKYPLARNKKIILWAPTFRGNAGDPQQIGMEEIAKLEQQLGEDYFLIRKVHPHVDHKYHLSNCDISTECLFPITDLLISDYSTVLHEFLFFDKPYVLFAPDLKEYEEKRGFYIPYDSLSPYIVTNPSELKDTILHAIEHPPLEWIARQRAFHASACDGKSTERILKSIGL